MKFAKRTDGRSANTSLTPHPHPAQPQMHYVSIFKQLQRTRFDLWVSIPAVHSDIIYVRSKQARPWPWPPGVISNSCSQAPAASAPYFSCCTYNKLGFLRRGWGWGVLFEVQGEQSLTLCVGEEKQICLMESILSMRTKTSRKRYHLALQIIKTVTITLAFLKLLLVLYGTRNYLASALTGR